MCMYGYVVVSLKQSFSFPDLIYYKMKQFLTMFRKPFKPACDGNLKYCYNTLDLLHICTHI